MLHRLWEEVWGSDVFKRFKWHMDLSCLIFVSWFKFCIFEWIK